MRPLLLVFLPLTVAYFTALEWCWDVWMLPEGYYGHGILVPLVAAVVIFLRRAAWGSRPAWPDRRGLWLLLPGLFLHLCGAALTIDSLSAASLLLAVPGAALLALGPGRLRGLWPVFGLLLFCVPLPLFVTGRLAFRLKEIAVDQGLVLANLFGLGASRDGATVAIPGQAEGLLVADPCGGLRSLLAMATIAYCIAFFLGPAQRRRRVVLLLAAAPVALSVNVLRIAAICWMAHWSGTDFAAGTGHDLSNGIAWIVDLAVVLGLDAWLTARASGAATPGAAAASGGPGRSPPHPEAAPAALRRPGFALWLIAGPLLFLSLYRPYGDSAGRAAALPEHTASFTLASHFRLTPRYRQLLGTDDAVWRSYVDGGGEPVYVVAVFHEANWKSVHPPDICIEGSNMAIVASSTLEMDAGGESLEVGRILAQDRGSGRPYLSLFLYGARGLSTGSYPMFFLHHAPRALLRRSNAGFLLRVESYADSEGGIAAAEARCRTLVAELLPAARGLLP